MLVKWRKKQKRQYGCKRYKDLPEDEKQKLGEYRKKSYKIRKKTFYHDFKKVFSFRKSTIILKSNDEEHKGILKLIVWFLKK